MRRPPNGANGHAATRATSDFPAETGATRELGWRPMHPDPAGEIADFSEGLL